VLKKIYSVFNTIRSAAICALLGWMVILCFIQVVLRYFTSASLRPFAWGDEIIRLTSIWVAFLAASIGVREGSHLSVDYFVNKLLGSRGKLILRKTTLVIVLISMLILVWYGIAQAVANLGSSLQNLPISMAWFYAAVPVGCAYVFGDYLLILIYGYHPFLTTKDVENQTDGSNTK
jgi:TRAP-type C4-dicarboxylate transport system permease small subunit